MPCERCWWPDEQSVEVSGELALEAPEGLFGLYMEAEGSGVVVKKEGTVSVNPATGQITTRFKEVPELPFSEVKVWFS